MHAMTIQPCDDWKSGLTKKRQEDKDHYNELFGGVELDPIVKNILDLDVDITKDIVIFKDGIKSDALTKILQEALDENPEFKNKIRKEIAKCLKTV